MKKPSNWKFEPLSALLSRKVTYGIVQPGEHVPGGSPLIRSQDYSTSWSSADDIMRVSPEVERPYLRSRVSAGDLLITVVGANIGKIATVPEWLDGANISRSVARISVNKAAAYPNYIRGYLQGGIRRLLHINSNGGAQPVLNLDDLRGFEVPLPPLPEQRRIAEILDTWDAALGKLDALIAAKERSYSATLESLIKKHGRSECRVRDVANEAGPRNRGQSVTRVLSVTNTRGFVLPEEYFNKQVASADTTTYKIVRSGEYAYNPSRINVGSIARLDLLDVAIVSPIYVVFSLNEKVEADYFHHWLNSNEARSRIRRSAQGSVRDSVNFDDFSSIRLPLPTAAQQKTIALLLSAAQKELSLLRQQRESLDRQKRGLMQKLLTGKIRVWRS